MTFIAIAGSEFGYLYWREPSIAPASDVKVEMTPERIARGKYIFENVADCECDLRVLEITTVVYHAVETHPQ